MDEMTGHNLPPDMAITAGEVSTDLSRWMGDHPTVSNEDEAREAKLLVDRGSLCVLDLEAERKGKTAPFRKQIEEINHHYEAPRELLVGVLHELKRRFDSFLLSEERRKMVLAQEAAKIAAQAEQAAREAERKEREAIDEARAGVVGIDVAGLTSTADQMFAAYQKAERQANLADRETKVKIGGGFRRALSLRKREIVIIDDPIAVLNDVGPHNAYVIEGIEKAARAYKKLKNKWPTGVRVEIERKT